MGPVLRQVAMSTTLALFVALAGCESEGTLGRSTSVVDSAGVRIVTSSSPAWPDGSQWRVDPNPELVIGQADGEPRYQLFRAVDATRLGDGRVVVLNHGTSELRVFSSEGMYLESFSREGDGPGELRFPMTLFAMEGDSIAVAHSAGVSVFDATGKFISMEATPSSVRARLKDGSLISLGFASGVDPYEIGYSRPSMAVLRHRPGIGVPDTITVVTGAETYRRLLDGGRGISAYTSPFGAERFMRSVGDEVITGDGSTFQVEVYDKTGVLRSIFHRPKVDRRVDRALIQQYENRMLTGVTEARQAGLRQLFAEWSYPESLPSFDRLEVDLEGNIWLRHYVAGGQDLSAWSIIDQHGRWLGDVELEAPIEVLEIGSEHILMAEADDLGVERIRLHRIIKE